MQIEKTEIPTSTKETTVQVEDKDIKVKVLQTLADEQSIYVYFEVDYGEQYKVVEKANKEAGNKKNSLAIPNVEFEVDGSPDLSYSGSVGKIKDDHTITYAYYIMLQKPLSEDAKVEMNINCFNIESQNSITHVEGNWNLGWKLSNGTAKRVYTLNKKLTINDTVITLESLELTPLSYKLIIDPENYDKVFQLEAIAKETKEDEFKTDENGNYTIVGYIDEEAVDNSLELKEDEGLVPAAEISQLFLEDKLFTGVGGPRSVTINGENSGSFSEVLDLDKVTAFRFGGQKISLTDCDYKTEISYENE